MSKTKNPKVFISYCWSSPAYETRIIEWAERLIGDGIDVLLDKWDLKEGQDKYDYMEKMVNDSSVSKVLIFSDKEYTAKAHSKKGGVGTESQIISNELYKNVSQEKFIPIVIDYKENGEPYLPTYLANRIYIDFSSPEKQHENYDKLVRVIFEKPINKKPPLGTPPKYLIEDIESSSKSKSNLSLFKDSIIKDKSNFNGIAIDYLDTYLTNLDDFRISELPEGIEFDEYIINKINELLPIRDEFIDFIAYTVKYKDSNEIYKQLFKFFEKCLNYKYRPEDATRWNDHWSEHLMFFIHEIFLYFIGILLKYEKFNEIKYFLNNQYILPSHIRNNENPTKNYIVFYSYLETLEHRNKRLNLRRLSLEADLFHKRATNKNLSFDEFMQSDFTLFLHGILNPSGMWTWYPTSLIYASYSKTFDIYIRAREHSYFDNLKLIMNVKSKEDLIEKYNNGTKEYKVNEWSQLRFHSNVSFEHLMNLNELDTI